MKPWIKTVCVFFIGLLMGVAATCLVFRLCFHPHHPPGAADAGRILKHLDSKLGLTADQKEKVSLLLNQELPKADNLRMEGDKKFKALRTSFHAQLRALLDPDQQKKLDEMQAKWENRLKQEGHGIDSGGTSVSMAPATGK